MSAKLKHNRFISLLILIGSVLLPAMVFAAAPQINNGRVEVAIPLENGEDYTVETKDQTVFISFNQSDPRRLQNLAQEMPAIFSEVQISPDNKSIILQLKNPASVHNIRRDNQLVLQFKPQDPQLALQSLDTRRQSLQINYGKHDKFSRFTFTYDVARKPVYTVKSAPDQVLISFRNPTAFLVGNLTDSPNAGSILQQKNKEGGVNLTFPGNLIKSFEMNDKIVLDIAPLMPKLSETDVILPPAQIEPVTVQSQNIYQNETSLSMPQIVNPITEDQIASLSFSWNVPVGLAVFQRGDYIWIIFDHSQNVDLESLKKSTANLVDEIVQLPNNNSTIIRILPKVPLNTFVRKEGLLWIVDLSTRPIPENVKDLPVYTQYNLQNQPYLFIPTPAAGNIVSILDPEVGDMLSIATSTDIGLGIRDTYKYPDFTLLKTSQGVALNSDAMDIMFNRGNTGLTIQGFRRGLNISPNLDLLKQHELLAKAHDSTAILSSDLNKELLNKSFIDAEDQLKQEIIAADSNKKDQARLELAKYYLSQGLGTNALGILEQIQKKDSSEIVPERLYGMLGVAKLMTRRYAEAAEDLSYGKLPENNEAVFWRTLALSALENKPENNAVLISYLNLIKNYPAAVKEFIAAIGANTALAANDDITTQSFIDILKTSDGKKDLAPLISYLNAEKLLMQGYPRNAIQEYRRTASGSSLKYASLARKKIIELETRLNVIPPERAAGELERLRFSWGEKEFKEEVLSFLADTYIRAGNYNKALQALQTLSKIVPAEQKPLVEKRMVKIFEDVYINNQADNMSALKALPLYHDFEWLAAKSKHYNLIVQKFADRLVAVDLLDRAYDMLDAQRKNQTLTPAENAAYGSRMALINLFNGQNHEALEILDETETEAIPQTLKLQRKIIRAKALAGTGRELEAIELLKDDYSKNALLLKTEIFWNGGLWGSAADTIKYLIAKPVPGQTLTDEQINYILDWATALKKAGRETVIVRLRNKFMPYFKDTKYYSAFSILTNTLEKDQINIRVIDKAIDDVETFSNFARIYNKSLVQNNLDAEPEAQ